MTLDDSADRWSPTQRIEAVTRQNMRLQEEIHRLKEYITVLQQVNTDLSNDYIDAHKKIKALQRTIRKLTPPLPKPPKPEIPLEQTLTYIKMRAVARGTHAWFLRAEGLTFREIGERIGVGKERAAQIVAKYGRHARWASRNTRWSIHD